MHCDQQAEPLESVCVCVVVCLLVCLSVCLLVCLACLFVGCLIAFVCFCVLLPGGPAFLQLCLETESGGQVAKRVQKVPTEVRSLSFLMSRVVGVCQAREMRKARGAE